MFRRASGMASYLSPRPLPPPPPPPTSSSAPRPYRASPPRPHLRPPLPVWYPPLRRQDASSSSPTPAVQVTATPSTLVTTSAGGEDEDEDDFESPSHSLTSSPADSALHTPPSNADVNPAVVVAGGANLGMQGVNASISASAYNHLHHTHQHHSQHRTFQQLHGIPKMMADGWRTDCPWTSRRSLRPARRVRLFPVGAAKLGNGRGVFAEQAIW